MPCMVRQGASVTPSMGANPMIGCFRVFQKDSCFIVAFYSADRNATTPPSKEWGLLAVAQPPKGGTAEHTRRGSFTRAPFEPTVIQSCRRLVALENPTSSIGTRWFTRQCFYPKPFAW